MNKDVFSRKNLELYEQLKELKNYVTQNGAGLNLSVLEINLIGQLCDEYRNQIKVVIDKRHELKTEATRKKEMRTTHLSSLRKFLNRMKNPTPGNPSAHLPHFKSKLEKPD